MVKALPCTLCLIPEALTPGLHSACKSLGWHFFPYRIGQEFLPPLRFLWEVHRREHYMVQVPGRRDYITRFQNIMLRSCVNAEGDAGISKLAFK